MMEQPMPSQPLPSPSAGIPTVLQPHLTCVSTHNFPKIPHLSLDNTVEYLLQAPRIVREVAAMTWKIIDVPRDGTLMLVWHPTPPNSRYSQKFPSDGYVWSDVERLFTQQYRGFIIEMFLHKVGIHSPAETMGTHCRKRYRLLPIEGANPNCDPSLWLVHYSRCDPQDQLPAQRIPVDPYAARTLVQRRSIMRIGGQLMRKEFMLYDRSNWPMIQVPPALLAQISDPNVTMAHFTRQQDGEGPPKRHRNMGPSQYSQNATTPHRLPNNKMVPQPNMARESALEEDHHEDQDMFDLLTPAEIALMRFTKHTEWAEELFASPFDTSMIDAVPLGFGRLGQLTSLTNGFFDAKIDDVVKSVPVEKYEPLGDERFSQFIKKAEEHVNTLNREIEEMKRAHEAQMEELRVGSQLRTAERGLRLAGNGDDPFKLETSHRNDIISSGEMMPGSVEDIVNAIESLTNKKIETVQSYTCVAKGGLEEKEPSPPPLEVTVEDTMMTDEPQDPLLEDPGVTGALSDGQNNDFGTEIGNPDHGLPVQKPLNDVDAVNASAPVPELKASDNNRAVSDDWVMINKDAARPSPPQISEENNKPTLPGTTILKASNDTGVSVNATLGTDLVDFDEATSSGDAPLGGGNFNDQLDFSNLDTAGEALAGFDASGNAEGGMQEDSAFGDAFHHTEAEAVAGKGNSPS